MFETGDLHLGLNDSASTCEMALQAITPDIDADTDNDGDADDDTDVAAVLEIGFDPDDSGGACGPHSATSAALIRVAIDVDAPDDPDPDATDADAEGNQSIIAIDATDSIAEVAISEDATRIAFATDAPLTSGDTDTTRDIYITGSPIVAAGSAQQGNSPNPEHNPVQTLLREATGTHRHVAVALHAGDFSVLDGVDGYHQLAPPAHIAQIDWTIDAGDLVTAGQHVQVGVYDGANQQPLRRLTYYLPPECYICT